MERYKPKTFVGQAPVLSTESKEQFESLRADFTNSIGPQDVIERMFCGEIACLVWEIMRWRRVRDAMLNSAMQNALHDILVEDLSELEGGDETIDYLAKWLTSEETRNEILEMLKKYGLDQSSIEAEAFRQSSSDVMRLEQILASATTRRERALYMIRDYRDSLADRLRRKADEVLENGKVLRLQNNK
jgi:hypothetical protein